MAVRNINAGSMGSLLLFTSEAAIALSEPAVAGNEVEAGLPSVITLLNSDARLVLSDATPVGNSASWFFEASMLEKALTINNQTASLHTRMTRKHVKTELRALVKAH